MRNGEKGCGFWILSVGCVFNVAGGHSPIVGCSGDKRQLGESEYQSE